MNAKIATIEEAFNYVNAQKPNTNAGVYWLRNYVDSLDDVAKSAQDTENFQLWDWALDEMAAVIRFKFDI